MDDVEHAVPPESYWDKKNHLQPLIGKQVFRDAPRGWTYTGFTQAPGKCVNMSSKPSKSSETGLPSSLYIDNDHCRVMFVPKPAIPGGYVNFSQAASGVYNGTGYQFKSSYDKPSTEEKK